jgi:mRNA interferase RelE/StbE
MYEVIFTKRAGKFINDLQSGYKKKLRDVITHLKKNPFSYPYKKIRGEANLYRIRMGKYRILYEIEDIKKRIVILKIDERRKVYKK